MGVSVGSDVRPSTLGSAVAVLLGSRALVLCLSVATGVLTARCLGPAGRGTFGAIVVWATGIGAFSQMGFPVVTTKAAAQGDARILYRILVMASVLAAIVDVPAILLTRTMLPHAPVVDLAMARLYFAAIPLMGGATILTSWLNGLQRSRTVAVLTVGHRSALLLGLIMLDALGAVTVSRVTALWVAIWVAYVVVCLAVTSANARYASPTRANLRGLLREAFAAWPSGLSAFFNANVDMLVASVVLANYSFGQYGLAMSAVSGLQSMSGMVAYALLPRLQLIRTDALIFAKVVAKTVALPLWVACLCLAIVGPVAVELVYGTRYHLAGELIPTLAIIPLLTGTTAVLYQAAYAAGDYRVTAIGEIYGTMATAIGVWLGYRLFGVYGVAIANTFSFVVTYVYIGTTLHSLDAVLPDRSALSWWLAVADRTRWRLSVRGGGAR